MVSPQIHRGEQLCSKMVCLVRDQHSGVPGLCLFMEERCWGEATKAHASLDSKVNTNLSTEGISAGVDLPD